MQARQKKQQDMVQIYIHLAAITQISLVPLTLWEEASDVESAFQIIIVGLYGAFLLEKYDPRILQNIDDELELIFRSSGIVNKINQLPDRLMEMVPASIKEWGKSIGMCSTTAYLTYAIKNKQCADNLYFELDKTITQLEAEELLEAIRAYRPKGLRIGHDEVFRLPRDSNVSKRQIFGLFKERLKLVPVIDEIRKQLLENDKIQAELEGQQNRP